VITCPILENIQFGTLEFVFDGLFEEIPVGTRALYSCMEGFQLSGPAGRECADVNGEGVWTGEEPSCIRKLSFKSYYS